MRYFADAPARNGAYGVYSAKRGGPDREDHHRIRTAQRKGEAMLYWLGEPACHDPATVGGKAANLSLLAGSYRVPAGFCLSAAALDGMFRGTRPGSTAGQAPDLPPALREPLIAAYQRLGMLCGSMQPCVAIRSSAVDEDGSSASFAGQHETYLNVSGDAAIAMAVVRCWESASTGRAQAYRDRHGLAVATPQLAVLVQHLIPADVSAVVFSANPVSGSREEVVITASWGLGESIVGGTVTPDVYTVRKEDLVILSRRISDKLLMTVPAPGGTREVAVPRFLQRRSALDDTQLCAMARLALDLEAAMGRAVDIECAWKAGELFLLQCRPITTLP